MPLVKNRKTHKERFRCEEPGEVKIIEKAHEKYCNSNHDNYDFVKEFFGWHSSFPGQYIQCVKNGKSTISIESWNRLTSYASL